MHLPHQNKGTDGWTQRWSALSSQPPALREGVKGLETVRFCFSAASNHKMLTKQQENYIDPIPKIDQNRREILTGRKEQKAESS